MKLEQERSLRLLLYQTYPHSILNHIINRITVEVHINLMSVVVQQWEQIRALPFVVPLRAIG